MKRIEHHVAQGVDAFVIVVGQKWQQLHAPLRREAVLRERGGKTCDVSLRDAVILTGEQHQHALRIVGHRGNEQAIIRRMYLEKRLRKQIEICIFR